MKYIFSALLAITVATTFSSCTTEREVTVVHHDHVYHHAEQHHTSTAPQDFGVVNQYDRMSR